MACTNLKARKAMGECARAGKIGSVGAVPLEDKDTNVPPAICNSVLGGTEGGGQANHHDIVDMGKSQSLVRCCQG
jgi:hypothetical protein